MNEPNDVPPSPMSEQAWQDIASAMGPFVIAAYRLSDGSYEVGEAYRDVGADAWFACYDNERIVPTHWMPLPLPPVGGVTGEQEMNEKDLGTRVDPMGDSTDSPTAAGALPDAPPMRHGGNIGGSGIPFYLFDGQCESEYDQAHSVTVWYDDLYNLHASHADVLAALKECRDAVTAAMRVVADLDAMHLLGADADTRQARFVDELKVAGVKDGFGVRANAAIAKAEGR